MRRGSSTSDSRRAQQQANEQCDNVRTKPPRIFDRLARRLLQFGVTVALTTFVGLIVRYAVKEFDPSVSTISVTTSKVDNKEIASLSVSKHFVERILEIIEESIAIVATVLPLGFPLCTFLNKYFAHKRCSSRLRIKNNAVFDTIPKYVIFGDSDAIRAEDLSTADDEQVATTQQQTTASSQQLKLRPLVRDTLYHLGKLRLKPKLVIEESIDEARRLGERLGLLNRTPKRRSVAAIAGSIIVDASTVDYAGHDNDDDDDDDYNQQSSDDKFSLIKSIDLIAAVKDSAGDIQQSKVRALLSRMKIVAQATPADKSLLVYLIKKCETKPCDGVIYFGHNFTDADAMSMADCALAYEDNDDDEVLNAASVLLRTIPAAAAATKHKSTKKKSSSNRTNDDADAGERAQLSFSSVYLATVTCALAGNVTQSFALYQVSAAITACVYRFLSIMVFHEQLVSRSQFTLLLLVQQLVAVASVLTKWVASLPREPLNATRVAAAKLEARAAHLATGSSGGEFGGARAASVARTISHSSQDVKSAAGQSMKLRSMQQASGSRRSSPAPLRQSTSTTNDATATTTTNTADDTGDALNSDDDDELARSSELSTDFSDSQDDCVDYGRIRPKSRASSQHAAPTQPPQRPPMHLVDLNETLIDASSVASYKQSFRRSALLDDTNLKLVKLHVTYQILVLLIIMVFGNSMFQLSATSNRQHQTLALNCLLMNNLLNLINCFNQFGRLNIKAGLKSHPFFVCLLVLAVFVQVALTELNAFGMENLNPSQWFFCFVFAFLGDLIAPFTGQQKRAQHSGVAGAGYRGAVATIPVGPSTPSMSADRRSPRAGRQSRHYAPDSQRHKHQHRRRPRSAADQGRSSSKGASHGHSHSSRHRTKARQQ